MLHSHPDVLEVGWGLGVKGLRACACGMTSSTEILALQAILTRLVDLRTAAVVVSLRNVINLARAVIMREQPELLERLKLNRCWAQRFVKYELSWVRRKTTSSPQVCAITRLFFAAHWRALASKLKMCVPVHVQKVPADSGKLIEDFFLRLAYKVVTHSIPKVEIRFSAMMLSRELNSSQWITRCGVSVQVLVLHGDQTFLNFVPQQNAYTMEKKGTKVCSCAILQSKW